MLFYRKQLFLFEIFIVRSQQCALLHIYPSLFAEREFPLWIHTIYIVAKTHCNNRRNQNICVHTTNGNKFEIRNQQNNTPFISFFVSHINLLNFECEGGREEGREGREYENKKLKTIWQLKLNVVEIVFDSAHCFWLDSHLNDGSSIAIAR